MADAKKKVLFSFVLDELLRMPPRSTFQSHVSTPTIHAILQNCPRPTETLSVLEGTDHLKTRKVPRITGFVEDTVPLLNFPEFRMRFRMEPGTFRKLLDHVGPIIQNERPHFEQMIDVQKQLLIYVYYSSTQVPLTRIADTFAVCEATVFNIIGAISELINTNLLPLFVKWPSGQRVNEVFDGFECAKRFPKVIGAVDGTHIAIKAPKQFQENYINRKKFHSINVCAVCDHEYYFTHVNVGWPGSCHDSRVFKNTDLYKSAKNRDTNNNYFPANSHLLGDSAYELDMFCMVPFQDNGNLTQDQKHFNYKLSATRVKIENSFGILKGRFRRLKYIDMHDEKRLNKFIFSCFVLHNICLTTEECIDEYLQEGTIGEEDLTGLPPREIGDINAVKKRHNLSALLSVD